MTDADADAEAEKLHAAAVAALRDQQQEAREELMAGFDSRPAILLWQHKVAARTIGRIDDDWHGSLLADRWTVMALLADQSHRAALSDHAPAESTARSVRIDIIQDDLIPAFQTAVSEWWQSITDYAGDEGAVDPTAQRWLAMRPRLHELATAQRRALRWALGLDTPATAEHESHPGPIRGREDLLEWVDEVVYATNGYVADDFAAQVATPASEWWAPLLETRGALLELLLATEVLPAMNRALREAADRAREMPTEDRTERSTPSI